MTRRLGGACASAAAALWLLAGGCNRGHGVVEDRVCADDRTPCVTASDCNPGVDCVPADTPLTTTLEPLGFLTQRAFPGEAITLKVVALRSAGADIADADDLAPLTGEVVTWTVVGSATDAALAADVTLTGDDGVATASLHTGTVDGVTFQVRAEVQGATAVTFSVQVRVDERELRLLTPAVIDSAVDRRERLRVQLVRPLGGGAVVPVPSARVEVQLVGGPRDGARLDPGTGGSAELVTDLTGVATMRFLTGDVVNLAGYELVFCPAGTTVCPEVPPVPVTVKVAERANTQGCQYFTDCAPGYVCHEGTCELGTTYCDGDGGCPPGYRCGAGRICEEIPPGGGCFEEGDCEDGQICGGANTCIDEEGCTAPTDCPDGWVCNLSTGACDPDPNPDDPVVDVSGTWLTRYHFDLSNVLPGFFQNGLLPVVAFLDLLFRSQIEIDIPGVGDIIEALLDQLIAEYVPPWVRTVTTILGDFILVFQSLEVLGEMTLYQPGTPNPYAVSGEEEWLSALFFLPSLCPGGIQQFESDRTCGQVDVLLEGTFEVGYSNNDPEVGVRVDPFAGQVQPPTAGSFDWWLHLYGRRVDVGLRQLLNVLLDVIVSAASGGQWYDFEQFLEDIIPCLDLRYAVEDLVCNITDGRVCSLPVVESLCNAAAGSAIAGLTTALGDVELTVLEMRFDQAAIIHSDGHETEPRALRLGDPGNPPPASALLGISEALIFDGRFNDNSWWYGQP